MTGPNVELMERRFDVNWGHSSMIFAQQRAYFELLHKHDCEFYINLSDMHYPLISLREMFHLLRHTNKSLMGYTFSLGKMINHVDVVRRRRGPIVVVGKKANSMQANAESRSGFLLESHTHDTLTHIFKNSLLLAARQSALFLQQLRAR